MKKNKLPLHYNKEETKTISTCEEVILKQEPSLEQLKYLEKKQHLKIRVRLLQILILITLIGLWEYASVTKLINPFIFSSPGRIIYCFCSMVVDKSLFYHIGITLLETLVSFFFILASSILIAMLLWWNRTASKVLEPYFIVLNSMPKSAMAPLFLVWLGATPKTIIVTAVTVAVFGSILNIYTGFMEVESDKLKLIRTLQGSKWDCLKLVVIPSSIPIIIGVMKVNIGLSLVGVIIGEFLAAKAGLGYLIIYGSQVFKLDWVIMSIVLLCMIAMGLYQLIAKVEQICIRRLC